MSPSLEILWIFSLADYDWIVAGGHSLALLRVTLLECHGNYFFSMYGKEKERRETERERKVHVIPMWRNQTVSHEFHKSWKKSHKERENESEQEW